MNNDGGVGGVTRGCNGLRQVWQNGKTKNDLLVAKVGPSNDVQNHKKNSHFFDVLKGNEDSPLGSSLLPRHVGMNCFKRPTRTVISVTYIILWASLGCACMHVCKSFKDIHSACMPAAQVHGVFKQAFCTLNQHRRARNQCEYLAVVCYPFRISASSVQPRLHRCHHQRDCRILRRGDHPAGASPPLP